MPVRSGVKALLLADQKGNKTPRNKSNDKNISNNSNNYYKLSNF